MRINEVSGVTKCDGCEAEVESPQEALRRGWEALWKDTDCHRGRCPNCQATTDVVASRRSGDDKPPGRLF
jgi:hypothetical protein